MEESELKKLRKPENVLKKRKVSDRIRVRQAKAQVENQHRNKRQAKKVPGGKFKRAERFIQQYRVKERDDIRLVRHAKVQEKGETDLLQRPLFVVRLRGVSKIHPKVQQVFDILHLKNVNHGSFQFNNRTTKALLKVVEPYVTWGFPSLKIIRELIYKRAHCRNDGKKLPLNDNALIEEKLGQHGIICIEDLVHELYTLGSNFTTVVNFLEPFQLSAPSSGWKKKRQQFMKGGDCGSREGKINSLLRTMI